MTTQQQLPKFTIGQTVKFVNDPDKQAGQVLSYSFDGSEFLYRITGRSVDVESQTVLEGIKVCRENELVEIKVKVPENL